MLRIGEFSKLSRLTIKALRFYEKEGILEPASVDPGSGYRFYETSQLEKAAKIRSYRDLGLSIDEIKTVLSGHDVKVLLQEKKQELEYRLSIIESFLEDDNMKYQVVEKVIPQQIVYFSETVLKKYNDCMKWIPSIGKECFELNPEIMCTEPQYEFCEYLDGEYKETDIHIRYSKAASAVGKENGNIKFKTLPETRVLSIYHKGSYNKIGEAYAFFMKYAEEKGYIVSGLSRECYIDGIWNKESEEDWLTEIQLPVE